jgi:quercetin dioxygenase-like cupin family protein
MPRRALPAGLSIAILLAPAGAAEPPRRLVVPDPPALSFGDGTGQARILVDAGEAGATEAALIHLTLSADAALPPHVHPGSAEVVHVLEGEGDLTASGKVHHVGPGDTILIPPGVVHAFRPAGAVEGLQMYVPGGPEQRFRGRPAPGTVPAAEARGPDPGGTEVVPLAKAPRKSAGGETYTMLLRGASAGPSTVDLMRVVLPGGQRAAPHDHETVSEMIYVLSGTGHVLIDGARSPLGPGTGFYTPRGSRMGIGTESAMELLVLVVEAAP